MSRNAFVVTTMAGRLAQGRFGSKIHARQRGLLLVFLFCYALVMSAHTETNPHLELDRAARANLRDSDLRRYFEYKSELISSTQIGIHQGNLAARKRSDEDVELTLRGYIWSCIEDYD